MGAICVYRTTFPLVSETFILEQVRNLTRYSPVFCTRTQMIKDISGFGVPVYAIGIGSHNKVKQHLFTMTRSPALLPAELSQANVSIVHAHFGPDGVLAMPLAKRLEVPLVVTFHGSDITSRPIALLRSFKPTNWLYLWHRKALFRQASVVLAVSDFVRRCLIAAGCPEDKVLRHYIGVDTVKFAPAIDRAGVGGERYVLCVARHTEVKGIDVLLRAFATVSAQHPDVTLVQVGGGELTPALLQLSEELGLKERVKFLGPQPHETVLRLMQGAEVFALPSRTSSAGNQEALGIVFLEAAACAVPVVSTWHGGIPEVVRDGETGFLVPENDVGELADRMSRLLSDPGLARSMGGAGRKLACGSFDIRRQSELLESIYDDACRGCAA